MDKLKEVEQLVVGGCGSQYLEGFDYVLGFYLIFLYFCEISIVIIFILKIGKGRQRDLVICLGLRC